MDKDWCVEWGKNPGSLGERRVGSEGKEDSSKMTFQES